MALAHAAGSLVLKPLHPIDPEQYWDCLRANLDSDFFMLGAFVDTLLKERMAGSAVLVSTVAARIGVARHEAVAAAKAGIEAQWITEQVLSVDGGFTAVRPMVQA